jgi:hypothetical protein
MEIYVLSISPIDTFFGFAGDCCPNKLSPNNVGADIVGGVYFPLNASGVIGDTPGTVWERR